MFNISGSGCRRLRKRRDSHLGGRSHPGDTRIRGRLPGIPKVAIRVAKGDVLVTSSQDHDPADRAALVFEQRLGRARAIAGASGLGTALERELVGPVQSLNLAEIIILGLLRQGVERFFGVLGHGSTAIGEVLRVYQGGGALTFLQTRSEIEASHAATAFGMLTGQTAAVVTSIGPGALHALAASLVPASNGVGVWYICGDETTYDEGVNLQQVPGHEQHGFLRLFSAMAATYTLHTPQSAPSALRRGLCIVRHPYQAGPFFLLCPLNTQVEEVADFDLRRLPVGPVPGLGAASPEDDLYGRACRAISEARQPVIKLGRGALHAGAPVLALAELTGAVILATPGAAGAVAYAVPAYLGVGGTKGSLCGNYAMEQADLLIAIGTRPVCQADCSRIGYPRAQQVININADVATALHYNRSVAMVGDAAATVERLVDELQRRDSGTGRRRDWVVACQTKKGQWQDFKAQRRANPRIYDPRWGRARPELAGGGRHRRRAVPPLWRSKRF